MLQEVQPDTREVPPVNPKASEENRKTPAPKETKPRGPTAEFVSASSQTEVERFVPVAKSVYNRLLRNLKIKAGKIGEINKFYEKVWQIMTANGGGMSETKLTWELGDEGIARLQVLRELAVVRRGKNGWVLAGCRKGNG